MKFWINWSIHFMDDRIKISRSIFHQKFICKISAKLFGEYSDVVASGYTGTELYTLLFLVIISYLLLFILSNQQPRAS